MPNAMTGRSTRRVTRAKNEMTHLAVYLVRVEDSARREDSRHGGSVTHLARDGVDVVCSENLLELSPS